MTDKRAAVEEVDEASGTLPAGFEFGAYVIGACIGRGGMARVYRAQHRALRKPVALKVMDGALLERPEWRHRFLREGQAAVAVKHPNVVDITDVGVWQGRPYLVMEFLEGEDLEQYLERHKPLSEAETARLMIPVVAGLATAHASGVVHRDLKPSNVFLARGPDGEVVPKLLDFGISKLNGALDVDPTSTPHGELMGSPMYMSPEAVRGARDLTPQSDQYSLGVVLYECVTGHPPFPGDSLLSVLEAVAHGRFEPPRKLRPDLSRAFEEAILRSMSADPEARFASVRDVGRLLCHSADHRTRLLWMPSFGLTEALESRTTAVLGTSPLRTVAPLNLPAGAASRARTPRYWGALVVLLGLCALGYVGWRQLAATQGLDAPGQPAVKALQPALEVGAARVLAAPRAPEPPETAAASQPPAPSVAGEQPSAEAAVGVANASAEQGRGAAPAAAASAAAARNVPAAARQRRPAPRHEPAAPQPLVAPAAEPASPARPPRAARALGPNRAPLLD